MDMKLEVVTLPVSDVDRAKSFYEGLGWRLDIDLVVSDELRTVQFTPPHSGCSIHIGKGLTASEPGSVDRLMLAVEDIDAARDDSSAAASRSARWPRTNPRASSRKKGARTSRPRRSATPTATAGFSRRSPPGSPAGNGRTDMDVASLANLLHETSGQHGSFEAVAPPHDWWDWYAAYMDARQSGSVSGGGLCGRWALHGGGQECRRAAHRIAPDEPRLRRHRPRRRLAGRALRRRVGRGGGLRVALVERERVTSEKGGQSRVTQYQQEGART